MLCVWCEPVLCNSVKWLGWITREFYTTMGSRDSQMRDSAGSVKIVDTILLVVLDSKFMSYDMMHYLEMYFFSFLDVCKFCFSSPDCPKG